MSKFVKLYGIIFSVDAIDVVFKTDKSIFVRMRSGKEICLFTTNDKNNSNKILVDRLDKIYITLSTINKESNVKINPIVKKVVIDNDQPSL